jgi:4-amino-4-deoxy-L-arabinose transferase and related glycosyltransferases of PMT family
MATDAHAAMTYSPDSSGAPGDGDAARPRPIDWRLLLLGVIVVSAAYVAWHLGRGWVPHDEGTLGQSAERVLLGELPHRDFDELYTGGLTWLNAGAFRVLGTTLITLRVVLFAVFLAWVPAVFYVASRLQKPVAAAGLTLLCVVWALPNYPAALPSWYNLFLAVFGVAALFRWIEVRHTRWLVAAGVAAGLSLIVKVIGLYLVAGVLLFLVWQSHQESRARVEPAPRRGLVYSLFATVSLLAFVGALAVLVRRQAYAGELIQFVLPGAALAALLVRNEWLEPAGDSRTRFVALARLVAPFLLGFVVPVAVFLVPYARVGALGALFDGVFVLPTKRYQTASYRMLSPWSMLALVPFALLVPYARRIAGRATRLHGALLGAALLAYLVATASVPFLYRVVWYAMRALPPVLVLLGVWLLSRGRRADVESPLLRARTMLLLSVTAVCTLVQFPFSVPIYYCYVAALAILVAGALLRYAQPIAARVPALVTAFLIAFAVLRVNTSTLFGMGVLYVPYPPTASLGLSRGGLEVPADQAATYHVAVRVLQQHARGGYTWASPDCPEIYFLSGLRNPTRTLFDFFDDPTGRTPRILQALERHAVTAVVLNRGPQFSPQVADDLVAAIEERYPYGADVGKFQVRWR